MRTINYYKAFGILVLGTFTALAVAQNPSSKEPGPPKHQQRQPSGIAPRGSTPPTPGNHVMTNGGYRQPGNHAGQDGNRIAHGTAVQQGGYAPGRHTTVVAQTPHGMRTEQRFAGGGRTVEATKSVPGGAVHAVRYGNGISGVVEHPLKPGYISRTYVRGGRVVDARVYSQHSFTRFGRTFKYQSVVPAVAFATAYYAWAVRPWPAPVAYHWGWEKEPWYAAYGDYFTPYSDYTSLDLWLTDYLISQDMRAAYQNWQADTYPDSETPDSETDSSSSSADTSKQTPPPTAAPPPMTPEVKQQLNTQIKLQLRERQKTTAAPSNDVPGALRPGHELFRVNAPLDVPSATPGGVCSLGPNDYIERTGDMDSNGNVPVEVKLSAMSDCSTGLVTRVSENDLEAMDSEQEEQLTQGMLAASKNMGPKGLPEAPGATPLLSAAGQTRADVGAPATLKQL